MRLKAEIWHTYRGTNQTKGKNPKPEKFGPGVQNGGWKMQMFNLYG
jgi:hypothetical protein